MANVPLPKVVVSQKIFSGQLDTQHAGEINWATANQSAIYIPSLGVKQSSGEQKPQPTASVAKAIAAVAILRKMPLKPGETGPTIQITDEDVALYSKYLNAGGSVFSVSAGQKLTQYQAMQAMLLPSANNIAVTLTRWAFGSDQAYLDYANQMVKELGMTNTTVADASGFSELTVSTAQDLVILGAQAHENPVLAEIVNQKSANILGREVSNVNTSLGVSGIDGIKTGFTLEAGGCLLFSSTQEVLGRPATVIGAILGAQTRDVALAAAPGVVNSSFPNIIKLSPIKQNQIVAQVSAAWGQESSIVALNDLDITLWKGEPATLEVQLNDQSLNGQIKLGDQISNLQLTQPIKQPDLFWRLTHPKDMLSYAQ